ncbi:MAG: thiolase family protein [Acidimicrobiia bacterium]
MAIVGVGSTGFARSHPGRSLLSLVAEAARAAIADAGVDRSEIDAACGIAPYVPGWFGVPPQLLAEALGLRLDHLSFDPPPIGYSLVSAVHAVAAGSCRTALVYNGVYRSGALSRSAARDPVRRQHGPPADVGYGLLSRVDVAAAATAYFAGTGTSRLDLARVVLNARSAAAGNELAALRDPLTLDEYLAAPMVRDPLTVLDCDLPVDGAEAFVVTGAERARDLTDRRVLVHAVTLATRRAGPAWPGVTGSAQQVAMDSLRERSELWIDDVDVCFPYDGFSIMALGSLEAMGYCPPGEVPGLLADSWSEDDGSLRLRGRVPVNPHGGSLAEGGSQGAGHLREAVRQLTGTAGARQVPGAGVAIVAPGGFTNAQGMILRRDDL